VTVLKTLVDELLAAAEHRNGWGGIRTHERLSPLPVFKTGAFNRSATHPEDFSSHPRNCAAALTPPLPDHSGPGRA
jgi:hypothetical protein